MYQPHIGESVYVPPFADLLTSLPLVTVRTLPGQNVSPWFDFHEMKETGDVVVDARNPQELFDDTSPTTYWALCSAGVTHLRLGHAYSRDTRYLAGQPVDTSDNPMSPHQYPGWEMVKKRWKKKTMNFPLGPYAIKLLDNTCRIDEKTIVYPKLHDVTTQFDKADRVVRFVVKPECL
jgi:hypothetical protein